MYARLRPFHLALLCVISELTQPHFRVTQSPSSPTSSSDPDGGLNSTVKVIIALTTASAALITLSVLALWVYCHRLKNVPATVVPAPPGINPGSPPPPYPGSPEHPANEYEMDVIDFAAPVPELADTSPPPEYIADPALDGAADTSSPTNPSHPALERRSSFSFTGQASPPPPPAWEGVGSSFERCETITQEVESALKLRAGGRGPSPTAKISPYSTLDQTASSQLSRRQPHRAKSSGLIGSTADASSSSASEEPSVHQVTDGTAEEDGSSDGDYPPERKRLRLVA